jgi:hypothetical protein
MRPAYPAISRASSSMMWSSRGRVLPGRRISASDPRGLQQTSHVGPDEVGLEVMLIDSVVLSDGEGRGERAQCRRYDRLRSPSANGNPGHISA